MRTPPGPRDKSSKVVLDRVRWKGEQTFRTLSYYFSIRWSDEKAGEHVLRTLDYFIVPPDPTEYVDPRTPGLPPQYSILKRGSKYTLLFGDDILMSLINNSLGSVLDRMFWHVNHQALRRTGDFLLIHAGAVSTPAGEAILFPARSGGGKTTLVTGLVRAGFQYLSDDAAPVDPVTRTLYPYPKAITLKGGTDPVLRDLYPTNSDIYRSRRADWLDIHWLRPSDLRPGAIGRPCRICFVVAHEYRRGATTEITPLTRAGGTMDLLRNTLNLSTYRARALPVMADIAEGARFYRMVSGDLDEAVRAITELTDGRRETGAQAG